MNKNGIHRGIYRKEKIMNMKIIVDVMSGDNAPGETLKGAFMSAREGCELILVGDEPTIRKHAEEDGFDLEKHKTEVVHTTEVVTMEDSALACKNKKDSSMSKSLQLLKEGVGDAVVSAGNTGALYTGASLIVSRIKGFRKAAIATMLPFENNVLLIDSGANLVVTDKDLMQFAIMGSVYMKNVMGVSAPRVGLLNNGTEPTKGTETLQNAYIKLTENENIEFAGNIECKALPYGVCDVLVADGFSGNVILKMIEGLSGFFFKSIKNVFLSNLKTKIAAILIKKDFKSMKIKFDASESGGAPILGIAKPVVKAHGSSDAKAIKNAIKYADKYAQTKVIEEISKLYSDKEQNEEQV